MAKEQQVQEQIQQHTCVNGVGSSTGSAKKSKGQKYNLLPQNIHDTLHND